MYKCRNRDHINLLECSDIMLVSKNRNDVISIYGSDELSSSSSNYIAALVFILSCFFIFSCSAIYLNFTQFFLN